MIDKTNPWSDMSPDAKRRIDSDIIHNIFWIKNQNSNFGFYLKAKEFDNVETNIRLRGVNLIKRNQSGYGELFLILNQDSDWQLFYSLCKDLITTCEIYKIEDEMVIAVETRLRRWQSFLMQNLDIEIPVQIQMGLFTELAFLKDVSIPSIGAKAAITAWVGPDFAKQDFSLTDKTFEIKSYITSKGSKILISSSHQLLSESKALYIIAYGLTKNEDGKTIADIASDINELINIESQETIIDFEQKLIAYGYMPGINYKSLYKFNIDHVQAYTINDDFPKILPLQLPHQIVELKYTIDLQLCNQYKVHLSDII